MTKILILGRHRPPFPFSDQYTLLCDQFSVVGKAVGETGGDRADDAAAMVVLGEEATIRLARHQVYVVAGAGEADGTQPPVIQVAPERRNRLEPAGLTK